MTMPATSTAPANDYTPHELKPGMIVSEEQVHSALEFLRDSAFKLGKATEREKKAEHMMKVHEGFGFQSAEGSGEVRKAAARTSDDYQAALNEHAVAYGEARKLYALREAASLVIEVYRTQSASLRHATRM